MTTDQYLRFASQAIAKKQPGPAHRHLVRAWNGGMDDAQLDRFAGLSESLDLLEEATGFRFGHPVDNGHSHGLGLVDGDSATGEHWSVCDCGWESDRQRDTNAAVDAHLMHSGHDAHE